MYVGSALTLTQFLCFACEYHFPAHPRRHHSLSRGSGFSALRVYALLDGRKFLAGVVLLLNLVPFALNLVSTVLCACFSVLPDYRAQYGYATDIIVVDSELCTVISPWSEGFSLRCVVINQHIWQCSDVFVRCACVSSPL